MLLESGADILYAKELTYAILRSGARRQPGLVLVLNNSGRTLRRRVKTGFPGKVLKPLTWKGKELVCLPQPVVVGADGWCEVEAPVRGYAVYGGAKESER